MRPLAAVWGLVSHPLRNRRRRGVFDDHGALHATPRARRVWTVFQYVPPGLWAGLALWRLLDGQPAEALANAFGALALAATVSTSRSAFLRGYIAGSVQIGIDARARTLGTPHDVTERLTPHPADPFPDVSTLE